MSGIRTRKVARRLSKSLLMWGLFNWWKWEASAPWIRDRTPWKREPLFINLLLTSQRWDDMRCRGAACFISLQSSLHHNPPHFFSPFKPPLPPSRFHFKCEVKVYVNICRASPPWRGNKSLDSCLNVWFFILSPAFLSLAFERSIPQGLCTHWISLFWQSKVERNVCNELSSCSPLSLLLLLLLPSLLSLYFLRGLDRDSSLPIWCRLDGQG